MTEYNAPVSLAVLWQRWQEIEDLPEHDKKVLAELAAMEETFIDQSAENFSDLMAKLRFLALLMRDHEWDDRIEKLYGSIEDGLRNQVGDRDPLSRIEDELFKIKGVGECLASVSRHAPEPAKVCDYLSGQLIEHAESAEEALAEIYTERRTKRDFTKNATAPKPEDAQHDLANLLLSALGPRTTVAEIEGARRTLQFMIEALPAPLFAAEAEGGAS